MDRPVAVASGHDFAIVIHGAPGIRRRGGQAHHDRLAGKEDVARMIHERLGQRPAIRLCEGPRGSDKDEAEDETL